MRISEIIQIPPAFITPAEIKFDSADTTFISNIGGYDVYVIPDNHTVIYCIFDKLDRDRKSVV